MLYKIAEVSVVSAACSRDALAASKERYELVGPDFGQRSFRAESKFA